MHNFHRAKRTRSSREPWRWIPPTERDVTATNHLENEDEDNLPLCGDSSEESELDESEEQEIMENSSNSKNEKVKCAIHYFQNWSSEITPENLRMREKKSYNSILYLAEATLFPLSSIFPDHSLAVRDNRVIIFRFRGQAFLLQ